MKSNQLYLSGFGNDTHKKPKHQGFYLTLDKAILSGVIITLLFALSFSLGVEKGRRAAVAITVNSLDIPETEAKATDSSALTLQVDQNLEIIDNEAVLDETPVIEQPIEAISTPRENLIDQQKEGYRIQVASFKNEESAQKETLKLQNDGFKATYHKSGDYMVIHVGGFIDKRTAQKSKQILQKKYKDCILKEPRRL